MQICSVSLFSDTFIHFCLSNESGHSLLVLYVEVNLYLLKKYHLNTIEYFLVLPKCPTTFYSVFHDSHGLIKSCLFQTKSIHGSLLNISNHPYLAFTLFFRYNVTKMASNVQDLRAWPIYTVVKLRIPNIRVIFYLLLLHRTEMTFDNYSVLLILHLQFNRTDLCFTMENTRTKIITSHSQFQKKSKQKCLSMQI